MNDTKYATDVTSLKTDGSNFDWMNCIIIIMNCVWTAIVNPWNYQCKAWT